MESNFEKTTFYFISIRLTGHFTGEDKGVEAEENAGIERLLADPSD